MPGRIWILAGAVLGFLAVAAGAFGAHALEGRLEPRAREVFDTAVRYHLVHALALVFVGALGTAMPSRGRGLLRLSGASFLLGVLVFSGSLYAIALGGSPKLGMVTPLGGLAFLSGWALLATAAARASAPRRPTTSTENEDLERAEPRTTVYNKP